jgi:hypothetical protein
VIASKLTIRFISMPPLFGLDVNKEINQVFLMNAP